jgi:hypothetical protein
VAETLLDRTGEIETTMHRRYLSINECPPFNTFAQSEKTDLSISKSYLERVLDYGALQVGKDLWSESESDSAVS